MNLSIGAIVVLILAIVLIVFASRIIVKLAGFLFAVLAVLGVMYYFSWGPFEEEAIDVWHLDSKYCLEEVDHDICECIIEPIHDDIHGRFSAEELAALKEDKVKSLYVFKKSLDASKERSMQCLSERQAQAKYKEFLEDLLPVNSELMHEVNAQTKKWWGKLKKGVEDFREDKEEIDDKY